MPERDGSGVARERCVEMGKNTGTVARWPDTEMATRKGNFPQIRVESSGTMRVEGWEGEEVCMEQHDTI